MRFLLCTYVYCDGAHAMLVDVHDAQSVLQTQQARIATLRQRESALQVRLQSLRAEASAAEQRLAQGTVECFPCVRRVLL